MYFNTTKFHSEFKIQKNNIQKYYHRNVQFWNWRIYSPHNRNDIAQDFKKRQNASKLTFQAIETTVEGIFLFSDHEVCTLRKIKF